MSSLMWRVLGSGSAILAGMLASKMVTVAWKTANRDGEVDPRDPRAPMRDAVLFAALTGLAVGAARVIAMRKAAEYYEKSAGQLPPQMREGDA
jgi:hypothetical protein